MQFSPLLRFRPVRWAVIAVAMSVAALRCTAAEQVFGFHHDNILGTSLDLQITAEDAQQAATVETAVLDEIERLRKILSTYDPSSDISRVNASNGPVACPQEVLDVLSSYDWWNAQSGGAYNGHLGELIAAWKAAEKAGAPPDATTLQPIIAKLAQPGWRIDARAKTVTRLTTQPLNVDSLGKGYIISKAVVAVRAKLPAIQGVLVNIGGDIYAYGHPADGAQWTLSVADPAHSEDNAPPLEKLRVSNRGVSTSAAYERGYTIAGRRYSHIFDPRTGQPATGVASATVIADNSASSNALATTLCVLKPEDGVALVEKTPGAECLIIGSDGRQYRSAHFAAYEIPKTPLAANAAPAATPAAGRPAAGSLWPAGYQVTLDLTLSAPAEGRRVKRPFVAVWVQDAQGKSVRTIAVWGNQRKYLPELHVWWRTAALPDMTWVATVTRATRAAGHYRLEWDGLDDHGAPAPPGTYTICQEVNREHGTYAMSKGTIVCGPAPAQGTIPGTTEFDVTQVTYGLPPQQ
jgi:thiamine biosynthesis lipoprotein ApbE